MIQSATPARPRSRRIRAGVLAASAALLVGAGAGLAAASPGPGSGRGYAKWAKAEGLHGKRAHKRADPDHDGLRNLAEYRLGTHPLDRDSDDDGTHDGMEDRDRDGVVDGLEDHLGSNPRGADDGIHARLGEDVEVKGVLKSVSPTQVVISVGGADITLGLPAGTQVSGDITVGRLVEVRLVRTPSGWVLLSHAEDEPGGGGATGTTTTTTAGSTTTTDDGPHTTPDDSGHRRGR